MSVNSIIGEKSLFAIEYTWFDELQSTEISMYVNGINLLAFERGGKIFTSRWKFDELAEWLRNYLNNNLEDPYPAEVEGEYAAIKDINARNFDSDDLDEFDAYYDKLDEWNLRHRWHTASAGAVLADLYFQRVGSSVEISWNNQDNDCEVRFLNMLGGVTVNNTLFEIVVDQFLRAYAQHWFN